MNKLSVKVIIAGRTYPLTINESEEEKVHAAVRLINSSIKQLQENYAVKDMQDLLAMTALQLATKDASNSVSKGAENNDDLEEVKEELMRLLQVVRS
jgi:cell division protein ZapA (FtsZ GTPase activity inhibitor)